MFKSYINYIYISLLIGLVLSPHFNVMAQDDVEMDNERYLNCIDLALSTPSLAEAIGKSWKNSGGGLPARHCVSLAQANMGQYEKAAIEFEAMARELLVSPNEDFAKLFSGNLKDLSGELLGQAGNVWLLALKPNEAKNAFSKALEGLGNIPSLRIELYIDRARASALLGEYEAAIEDLDLAQVEGPERPDIFVFKASAKRLLKKYGEAFSDVELALFRDPENREGLLERGNLRRIKGDIKGAKDDWSYLIALYPDSPSAKVAQKNINTLKAEEDFKVFPDNN